MITKKLINKWISENLEKHGIKTRGYRVEWILYLNKNYIHHELSCVSKKDIVDYVYERQNVKNNVYEIKPHITNLHDDDVALHSPIDGFVWANNKEVSK